jgi:hypothetical protein
MHHDLKHTMLQGLHNVPQQQQSYVSAKLTVKDDKRTVMSAQLHLSSTTSLQLISNTPNRSNSPSIVAPSNPQHQLMRTCITSL